MDLDVLKRQIKGEIQNETAVPLELLDSTESEHPLFEALRGYRRWVGKREYENGAKLALEKFEEGIQQSKDANWDSVTAWAITSCIELIDEVSDAERLEKWIGEAVELLEENYSGPDVHEGNAGSLIEAIAGSDLRSVEEELVESIVDICWTRSEYGGRETTSTHSVSICVELERFVSSRTSQLRMSKTH